jgi:hypothetical protein
MILMMYLNKILNIVILCDSIYYEYIISPKPKPY